MLFFFIFFFFFGVVHAYMENYFPPHPYTSNSIWKILGKQSILPRRRDRIHWKLLGKEPTLPKRRDQMH